MGQRRAKGHRPDVLRFRVSIEERDAIRSAAEADGLAVGAWLSQVAMSAADRRTDPVRAAEARERLAHLDAVRTDFHRPGSNLNQIARAYNGGEPVSLTFADAVLSEHQSALVEVRRLMDDYRRWLGRR